MSAQEWTVHNPSGKHRVIVTKQLPGTRWLEILLQADCRVEVCNASRILSTAEIRAAIGARCDGAIGQLPETWNEELFVALQQAEGKAYSNYAVGFNNVDLPAATRHRIPVGNTPGVLTETTAELAVALTCAAARRVVEADTYMRTGQFDTWLPSLFLGQLLWRKTVGVVGPGRIGSAYARMMVEGHKMNLIYYGRHPNRSLEDFVTAYGAFLQNRGEPPVTCRQAATLEELLQQADVVSLHTPLTPDTTHLLNAERLAVMKTDAILVNTSRGPLVDEAALVAHCRNHPGFRAGLDVFEAEPAMQPGLPELSNVVMVPHIGSATRYAREGMAILAATNVAAVLRGYPVWTEADPALFLSEQPPQAAPSILNAKELDLPVYGS